MPREAVDIRVEVADALLRPSQLLVVKYAQYSYGVDAQVAATLRISPVQLPAPGSHLHVDSGGRIAAASVLFLGVPDLSHFGYRQIREFGHRAVSVASEVCADAREVCVTLHGPGFGLDETESFVSEVAGLVEAISANHVSPNLRAVTFIEMDQRRAERINKVLSTLLPGRRAERDQPISSGSIGAREAQRLRSVGYDSGGKSHAFVAMPFAESYEDVFHYGIAPSIRGAGFLCERIDEVAFTGDIVHRLRERISSATFLVADVTGANPNVYLEIGFAWGRDVPAVLLCNDASELKFDIQGQRCIIYRSIKDLETKLSQEIRAMFPGYQQGAYH